MRDDILVVTGYVPIAGHPRSAAEYGELGENLFGKITAASVHPFYESVPATWVFKILQDTPFSVQPSVADNPAKNTIAYHCVQHQKFGWLLKAALIHPLVQTLVWMDYGIGHVSGVTPEVVNEFLDNVAHDDLAIPGCWEREYAQENANYLWPNWRFCGGLMVVPAMRAAGLYKAIKMEVARHINATKNLTWEVNTLAQVEKVLPIRWYKADHDASMFNAYGVGLCTKH